MINEIPINTRNIVQYKPSVIKQFKFISNSTKHAHIS